MIRSDNGDSRKPRLGARRGVGMRAGLEGARFAGAKAGGVVRSKERGNERMDELALESADQLVETLGTMKGAAMKMGQLASFIDTRLPARRVPRALPGEARHAAHVRRRRCPGRRCARCSTRSTTSPARSCSRRSSPRRSRPPRSGRSTAAMLPDGRRVAVKIQYPGIDAAIRADLSNAGHDPAPREGARARPRREGGRRTS